MSYEGQGAEDDRLIYVPNEQEFAERGYYLFWGSLTMNVAAGALVAEEEASVPYSGADVPGGETLVLGPALVYFLRALTRTGTHPVAVIYQMMLDGAAFGAVLNVAAGAVGGTVSQMVEIPNGWHRLRIDVTPSAANATSSRYAASVWIAERGP